ncbi:MAG: tRNA lysidine(34) synthetase TilS [Chlorobi bacterium]|nr:tRNA lysidine(34) synthetase TilS [Chlorobiota bacterium]
MPTTRKKQRPAQAAEQTEQHEAPQSRSVRRTRRKATDVNNTQATSSAEQTRNGNTAPSKSDATGKQRADNLPHAGQASTATSQVESSESQKHSRSKGRSRQSQQKQITPTAAPESSDLQPAARPSNREKDADTPPSNRIEQAEITNGSQTPPPQQVPDSKRSRRRRRNRGKQRQNTADAASAPQHPESQATTSEQKELPLSAGPHQTTSAQQKSTPTYPRLREQQRPRQPRRVFVVRDLVQMPDIPNDCVSFIERIERTLRNELAVETGATIVVALSGGIDSIVLLDVLFILSYEHGYALHIAHVNHRLRSGESDRDEAFVRSVAKHYDLSCHITHVETESFARQHRLGIEEAARELRYRFLRQMCGTVHAQYCAVAHTADDTAETLLLNLFRGSGLTGLSSIPPKRPLTKKAQLIRPLLGITREEIVSYANARNLRWVEDSSNTERAYRRNRLRLDILPTLKEHFNPRIVETLARTAALLRQADGFIESLLESTYAQIATVRDGRVELDRTQLVHLHPFVQGEIIERAIGELTAGKAVSRAAVERVLGILTADIGTRHSVIGGIEALADRHAIVLSDEQAEQAVYLPIFKLGTYSIGRFSITLEEVSRNDVRLGTDPNIEYFDYDKLPYRLFLRTWQAGDRFAPIGMHGERVLVADYLTNAKVSEHDRRTAAVLSTTDSIVWLCGYRMSEMFKLTNETRRIIRATFQRT